MGMNSNVNIIRVAVISTAAMLAVWGGILATGALAQDATPTPAPTETPAPVAPPSPPAAPVAKVFYLEVDGNDLTAISQALMELPKKIADPLVLKLNAQLQAQEKIVAAKTAAEKKPKGK